MLVHLNKAVVGVFPVDSSLHVYAFCDSILATALFKTGIFSSETLGHMYLNILLRKFVELHINF